MFIAASAALVLSAACTKTEVTRSLNDEETPIGFSNYAPRTITKAGNTLVNEGALPVNSIIGVYGYSTGEDVFAGTENPTFMDETFKVTYASANSSAAEVTNVTRYWPKTITNLLSFYGYYPYGNGAITSVPTSTSTGMGSFGFTQTNTVNTMVDFMVSDVANDYYYTTTAETNALGTKANEGGSVPLKLRHMLAKVNFKFNKASDLGDDIVVKVTSAYITNVLSTGTLTPSYSTTKSTGNLGTTTFPELWQTGATPTPSASTPYWDAVNDVAFQFVIPIDKGGNAWIELQKASAGSDINSATEANTNFLFVPQTLSDNVKVTINYTIKQGDADPVENTSTVQLNTVAPASWGVNDNIVYTFTIGLTPIKFTALVQPWDTPEIAGAVAVN